MPLPKNITPTFDLILPSTEKPIKYRPILVKEEKILLMALETKDNKQITNAIKQILKSCILTKSIKVEELPTFDIEYIFLNIRAKSVGENLDLIVTCGDDGETQVPVTIFIDDIKVQKNPEHSRDIKLSDNMILRMKYPSLNKFIENNFDFAEQDQTTENIQKSFELISSSMESIFDGGEAYSASDYTQKEKLEFIEGLTTKQFKLIEDFFTTMPVLKHEFTVTNPKTKEKNTVKLEGLANFMI